MIEPDLFLEITRWCNMECIHCLRGEREKLKMSDHIITAALSQCSSIGTLTLTGGEPTTAVDRIERVLLTVQNLDLPVQQLMIITNGKQITRRFLDALTDWSNWLTDAVYIDVSRDQYHEDLHWSHFWELEEHVQMIGGRFHVRGPIPDDMLCGEGRAYYNLPASRGPKAFPEPEFLDNGIHGAEIYVNAKGQVIAGCDYSFDNQDERTICTVEDDIEAALCTYYGKSALRPEYA